VSTIHTFNISLCTFLIDLEKLADSPTESICAVDEPLEEAVVGMAT
jgi:hypothetical protein